MDSIKEDAPSCNKKLPQDDINQNFPVMGLIYFKWGVLAETIMHYIDVVEYGEFPHSLQKDTSKEDNLSNSQRF
jgi:hypothetical protein